MKILAIETSCDETAVAILDASGSETTATYIVSGDALYSQAAKHATYGGVFPSLAKREHAANLVPLLDRALTESGMRAVSPQTLNIETVTFLQGLLAREEEMLEALLQYFTHVARPDIDAIAVTCGPGLEPALWVGVNFARALALVWNIPIIPVNHLEGHMVASAVTALDEKTYRMSTVSFPILCLVISGGHTEFIYADTWGSYAVVGATRDDSVGEAFDKVARLLDIPYPGGPGLSKLAERYRLANATRPVHSQKTAKSLPRPMMQTDDLDLSFSGLKTAVLYWVRDMGTINDQTRAQVAAEFEDAVADVLATKTTRALERYPVHAFLLGGGVSANTYIRARLKQQFSREGISTPLFVPAKGLSTDNAVMIGMAAYLIHLRNTPSIQGNQALRAQGNLSFRKIGTTKQL